MKTRAQKQVLLVEDDPVSLKIVEALLKKENFVAQLAEDADEALQILEAHPQHFFQCVITDYQLPGMNGVDLMHAIQQKDPTLSIIIITVKEDRALIQDSFRGGACDFLNKPINPASLNPALERALKQTDAARKQLETERGLREAYAINALFSKTHIPEGQAPAQTFFHPRHEVGGDFLSLIPNADSPYTLVLGDISGHDLRSTLLSVYFQGLMRGILSQGGSLKDIICKFNTLLSTEWAESDGPTIGIQNSLSICMPEPDLASQQLRLINCGSPYPLLIKQNGRISAFTESTHPLGWFEACPYQRDQYPLDTKNDAFVYAYTDGLLDHANALKIDACSLAYKLLASSQEEANELLQASKDDILIARIQVMQGSPEEMPHPILFGTHKGSDHEFIDTLQRQWERSLLYAFGKAIEEPLNEILLCIRELMLNAFIHGCKGEDTQQVTLQAVFYPSTCQLKVCVDDTGVGHNFDIKARKARIEEEQAAPEGGHLGLVLVSEISDNLEFSRGGASISCEIPLPQSVTTPLRIVPAAAAQV